MENIKNLDMIENKVEALHEVLMSSVIEEMKSNENVRESDEETLVYTTKTFDDNEVNRETFGCGILDSGCSKTVCGTDWLETYLDMLTESELKEVKFEESDARFKFGNEQVYKSSDRVTFPAVLGGKSVLIASDVVNTNIPLLLSKSTMKKAKTVIDFENDSVKMFGKRVRLMYTSFKRWALLRFLE